MKLQIYIYMYYMYNVHMHMKAWSERSNIWQEQNMDRQWKRKAWKRCSLNVSEYCIVLGIANQRSRHTDRLTGAIQSPKGGLKCKCCVDCFKYIVKLSSCLARRRACRTLPWQWNKRKTVISLCAGISNKTRKTSRCFRARLTYKRTNPKQW